MFAEEVQRLAEEQKPAETAVTGQDTASPEPETTAQPAETPEAEQPEQKPEKPKKKRSPMGPIQSFFLNALLIVTAVWLLAGFVFGFATAPNSDMAPNIKFGDLLLYYQLSRDYAAQDVVVLRKNDTTYVGRIVAKGGDTVEITDSEQLVINGDTMIEPNVYGSTPRYEGFVTYPLTLGEDEYFVLVDARTGGEDSRYYGAVSGTELCGKVITLLRRNHL